MGRSSFIHKIASKRKARYKFVKANQELLSPSTTSMIKTLAGSSKTNFSPVSAVTKDPKKAKPQGTGSDGAIYERVMESSEWNLWKEKTPPKGACASPNRVVTREVNFDLKVKPNKRLIFANDSDTKKTGIQRFSFKVTKEDILRCKRKRKDRLPCSQKKLMGNVPAKELMTALGAEPKPHQGGHAFHYAHRRAKFLNGKHVKSNIDPMTDGGNYNTLFWIEMPIRDIILKEKVSEVFVEGEMEFDSTGLAVRGTYEIFFGLLDSVKITIDPRSHSKPSLEDYRLSRELQSMKAASASC